MKETGIGSTVWEFDQNYREYRDRLPGERYARGGPIWIKHWRPAKIVSETSRSWVTSRGTKIPKTYTPSRFDNYAVSEDYIRRREWVEVHRHQVAELINRIDDGDVIQRIAEWIGFKPERHELDTEVRE